MVTRKRARAGSDKSLLGTFRPTRSPYKLGLVLSGGGSRAAYQVGALRALFKHFGSEQPAISAIIGSSIGAVNGLMLSACLKGGTAYALDTLEEVWRERTFRNTFVGTPSQAFIKAVQTAIIQYLAPGPNATDRSIFDPSPLGQRIEQVINQHGGLHPDARDPQLEAVGVMTTVEGATRRPLLFLSTHRELPSERLLGASFEVCYVPNISAKHGMASAALPSILPPVELNTEQGDFRLVDGGISQNVPVDPVARLGVRRVAVVDISGRSWWHDQYNEPHDTRPTWEVPAGLKTFCIRPPDTLVIKPRNRLGGVLQEAVAGSTKKFMAALGPTFPLYSLLKNKFGELIAYEAVSYVALDTDYINGLIELGYNETLQQLRKKATVEFTHTENLEKWAESL